jgi:hypothetical protein
MAVDGNTNQLPGRIVHEALIAARSGEMPTFTPDSLLAMLRLDGDTPDGLGMMERFAGERPTFDGLRAVIPLMRRSIPELLLATNERKANSAQEQIAFALGTAVTRQVEREQDMCPGVSEMALMSTRPDIISPDVRRMAFANLMLDQIFAMQEPAKPSILPRFCARIC